MYNQNGCTNLDIHFFKMNVNVYQITKSALKADFLIEKTVHTIVVERFARILWKR